MVSNIFIAFVLSGAFLANWWFAMFSDSGPGQMARAMRKSQKQGKNVIPLMLPAAGLSFMLWGVAVAVELIEFSDLLIDILGYTALFIFAIALLGLFPIPLPGWMYPEYHLARRERVRVEKLARGEVVRMPSSGPAAVEAQRIEQALRAQERQGESGK